MTAPAQIVRGPRDYEVVWGTEVVLECEVVGVPFPSRSWTKNGKVVSTPITLLQYQPSTSSFPLLSHIVNHGIV